MVKFISNWQPIFFVAACLVGICLVGLLFYFLKVWCRACSEPGRDALASASGKGVVEVVRKGATGSWGAEGADVGAGC